MAVGLKDPDLCAELAELAPRIAAYFLSEVAAGEQEAIPAADAWTALAMDAGARMAEYRRQEDALREEVLARRRAYVADRAAQGRPVSRRTQKAAGLL